jgi:NADPH:quinone reductase-like Zn-dependent oxidoreductase
VKAWIVRDGFGIDQLALVDREVPDPGPGQVRVALRAWSLNYRDWMVITGAYNPRQALPLVPLSDGAGVIEAVGAGVRRVVVGDRVAAAFAQRWIAGPPDRDKLASALGGPGDGVAAERVVLDDEGVVKLPDHLSFEEAATLPCAAVTAWCALFEHDRVGPAHTVLVQGSGGVSVFALQLARLGGARVIATSSSERKRERLAAMGAWHTLDYRADPQWGRTVRSLTGAGVDHVVEVGGAGTMEQSLHAVRTGGTISIIGVLAGAAGPIALTRVLMNAVRLQGVVVGPREAFERMNAAIAAAQLRPVIDRAFAFDELPAALAHLESGAHFGKVVLRV